VEIAKQNMASFHSEIKFSVGCNCGMESPLGILLPRPHSSLRQEVWQVTPEKEPYFLVKQQANKSLSLLEQACKKQIGSASSCALIVGITKEAAICACPPIVIK